MDYLKAIDRVRKLLKLAENAGSEEEAALAAARAAELMAEHKLSQAELSLASGDDKSREAITEGKVGNAKRKRIAWQSTIANAVAKSYGCKQFWRGADITIYGRESSVQATTYTSQYLFNEVERLCESAYAKEPPEWSEVYRWNDALRKYVLKRVRSNGRAWKNAFRNGAANAIALRLVSEVEERRKRARAAARAAVLEVRRRHDAGEIDASKLPAPDGALILVEREQAEVDQSYKVRSKGFKTASPMGYTSSRSGYSSGREAGEKIAIGGKRAGLGAGQGRLK